MDKLKIWDQTPSWQEAEKLWDAKARELAKEHPIKKLSVLPSMPGISPETAKNLKWKSLRYILKHDTTKVIQRYILKRPIRYFIRFLKSLGKKKSYLRDGDFFYYGISSSEEFKKLLEDKSSILVAGFSYCHKPLECPSGRFTSDCMHEATHPVCRQCFIGKAVHALPEKNSVPLFIPTIHYIGEKIFEILEKHPHKKILFLITACEMTLEMFGDFGNMAGIKGIGVRLDGRICNTMKAFVLSEHGIKPGLTVVLEPTKQRILDLIQHRRAFF